MPTNIEYEKIKKENIIKTKNTRISTNKTLLINFFFAGILACFAIFYNSNEMTATYAYKYTKSFVFVNFEIEVIDMHTHMYICKYWCRD